MSPGKRKSSFGKTCKRKVVLTNSPKQAKKKNAKKTNPEESNEMKETFTSPSKIRTKSMSQHPIYDKIVGNENVLNSDFIPLTSCVFSNERSSLYNGPRLMRVSDSVVSSTTSKTPSFPVTITVDDDVDVENDEEKMDVCVVGDDTVGLDEIYICDESVNDSVQIVDDVPQIVELSDKIDALSDIIEINVSASLPKKRKLDNSIEILEIGNSITKHIAKRAKTSNDSNNHPSSTAWGISRTVNAQTDSKQDDDIIIVDAVDSRNRVKDLNDFIPLKTSALIAEKKESSETQSPTRKGKRRAKKSRLLMNQPAVFQDSVGNSQKHRANYKSPLSSISNKDSDTSVSYHNMYGNNMYNPNSVEKIGLRPVVIDGSNVAFGHGGKSFSTRGIQICVNYFVKRGHMVVAFVPLFRRSEVSDDDRKILDDLQTKRQLAFTPSRFLHGRRVASYDDRFIVQCAAELGGIVVSTDNYRDLVCENEAWRETIEKRLLMFTWVGDILMFPDDPNGRGGPRLEEFLRFPQ